MHAIQKYGWDSFSHEVVVKNLTFAEAISLEIMLIKFYKTTNPEFGYNCSTGGECGNAGCTISDETRAKLSAAAMGRKLNDETREKIRKAAIGRTHTDKARAKMSKPKSAEHSAKSGKGHRKPVIQYLNGIEIARFPSIKAAKESTNANIDISKCCRGKLKTSGGYSWAYTQRDTSVQISKAG